MYELVCFHKTNELGFASLNFERHHFRFHEETYIYALIYING